ncbi:MAG TPA: hypothetical protein DD728_08275 [Hyphomonas atlantica]|uniref:HTH cro/C1-type domain-containing protein n=1 Tax=Hyphomonas atlantica TaxID=1280948 RepID=A0A356W5G3_9PROT|nr:hypothetical protein [Hyphomonas atlantica]|tara:strand:- start:390 stop:803 length:414 start_codon:yes stop_codon:yes gene_type:complete
MSSLSGWRKANRRSLASLGEQIGLQKGFLSEVERGLKRPSVEAAKRIEAATDGEVTAAELLGISGGVSEEATPFEPALASEARALGLDPNAIARTAVEEAVKRARMDAWNEKNREAVDSWNKLVEREGLWSDDLRAF